MTGAAYKFTDDQIKTSRAPYLQNQLSDDKIAEVLEALETTSRMRSSVCVGPRRHFAALFERGLWVQDEAFMKVSPPRPLDGLSTRDGTGVLSKHPGPNIYRDRPLCASLYFPLDEDPRLWTTGESLTPLGQRRVSAPARSQSSMRFRGVLLPPLICLRQRSSGNTTACTLDPDQFVRPSADPHELTDSR